jgi:hypothetical protein
MSIFRGFLAASIAVMSGGARWDSPEAMRDLSIASRARLRFTVIEMELRSLPLLTVASIAFVAFAILLIFAVAALLRSNKRQLVATGRLVAEQEFDLPAVPLLLLLEVPRFGSNFRDLEFDLIGQPTGKVITLSYNLLRAQGAVYGVTTMRVPIGRLTVEQPGLYLLRVNGLPAGAENTDSRILFSRPYLARMILQIIAIVLLAIGLLLSLLLALWQVFPPRS